MYGYLAKASRQAFSTIVSTLKKRAVAVSFIFNFPLGNLDATPKVALFRRSGAVRTYRHKYGPISGGVEPSDASTLATAWRELQEETTLTSTSLELFRKGKPYTFSDASVGREWTISPFAFVLKQPSTEGGVGGSKGEAGIRIDWEHEGFAWFSPTDVSERPEFEGVPRLLESLRRVWFEIDLGQAAGGVLDKGLRELHDDHYSGAHQLAGKALDVFISLLPHIDATDKDASWRIVRFAGWHLWKNGREAMNASILNVVLCSLAIIERSLFTLSFSSPSKIPQKSPPGGFVNEAVAAMKEFAELRELTSGWEISEAFVRYLHEHYPMMDGHVEEVNIVTLSYSSTITAALIHAMSLPTTVPLHVHVLESRPLFEGVTTARRLAPFLQNGIHSDEFKANPRFSSSNFTQARKARNRITLHTDSSTALASQNAQIILLGAEIISPTGTVIDKIGSLPLVLAAMHVSPSVQVVALAEREKVLPFEASPALEENDATEVTSAWDEGGQGDCKGHGEERMVHIKWGEAEPFKCTNLTGDAETGKHRS